MDHVILTVHIVLNYTIETIRPRDFDSYSDVEPRGYKNIVHTLEKRSEGR